MRLTHMALSMDANNVLDAVAHSAKRLESIVSPWCRACLTNHSRISTSAWCTSSFNNRCVVFGKSELKTD